MREARRSGDSPAEFHCSLKAPGTSTRGSVAAWPLPAVTPHTRTMVLPTALNSTADVKALLLQYLAEARKHAELLGPAASNAMRTLQKSQGTVVMALKEKRVSLAAVLENLLDNATPYVRIALVALQRAGET